jgi:hypothetical protein
VRLIHHPPVRAQSSPTQASSDVMQPLSRMTSCVAFFEREMMSDALFWIIHGLPVFGR